MFDASGTVPFNAAAPPLTNPGRAGTKIGLHDHHPPASRGLSHWHDASILNLTTASSMHGHAQDLIGLSFKTHSTTKNINIQQHQVVDAAFGAKVQTSRQLCDELDERVRNVSTSLQRTKASLASLQTAYNAKTEPRSLCSWRQTTRAKRPPREMVRDNVELALEAEKEMIISSQDKLQNAMSCTEQMLHCLNDTLRELSHDHECKKHALQVDEACMRNTHTTWPTAPLDGTLPSKTRTEASAPYAQWHDIAEQKRQQDTIMRIQRSKEKETYSLQLRDENDSLIEKTAQDCHGAKMEVENKLQDRIAEVQAKRRDLELSMQETVEKMEQMSQMRALTDTEIRSHDEPELILKQRMDLRAGRHSTENISDPVTTEILEQQHSLKKSKAMMERRKEEEKQSLAMLLKAKADLQADFDDKTVSLELDLQCQKTGAQDSKVMANLLFN